MAQAKPRSAPKKVVEAAILRVTNYKQTFTSKTGREVLLDLLGEHYMLKTTYYGPENDEGRSMAYRDGQRSVVLRIMQVMGLDTAEMYLLIKQGDDNARAKTT